MSGLSNQNEIDFINHNFRPGETAIVSPLAYDISLHIGDPGEDGQLDEVVGGSYSRAIITVPTALFGPASGRQLTSIDTVLFTGMPAVTVTHAGYWRSTGTTAADFLGYDELTTPVAVPAGLTARFPAGSLTIKFSDLNYTDYLVHAWLDFIWRNQAYTRPTGHNHQIYDGDPTGAGVPIAGSSPLAIAFGAPTPSGSRHESGNTAALQYTGLTGGDNLDHWGVEDTETTPNLLAYRQQLSQPITPGGTVDFAQDTGTVVGID